VGIVVGIRNIGNSDWTGSPTKLSRMGVGAGNRPEHNRAATGASEGPCPGPLIKSRAPVQTGPVTVSAQQTAFECVRFTLPRGVKPILYKFASQNGDYALRAAKAGRGYGVWALPGTLVEKCRYEPSQVRGRCHGLEVDED
jgi:hypothetical protein